MCRKKYNTIEKLEQIIARKYLKNSYKSGCVFRSLSATLKPSTRMLSPPFRAVLRQWNTWILEWTWCYCKMPSNKYGDQSWGISTAEAETLFLSNEWLCPTTFTNKDKLKLLCMAYLNLMMCLVMRLHTDLLQKPAKKVIKPICWWKVWPL